MTLDIYPFIVQKNEKPYLFKFDENASHKGIKISARSEDVIEFEPVIFEFPIKMNLSSKTR